MLRLARRSVDHPTISIRASSGDGAGAGRAEAGSAIFTSCPRLASARASPHTRSPTLHAIPSGVKTGQYENNSTLAIRPSLV
jgi:hypothetical protein